MPSADPAAAGTRAFADSGSPRTLTGSRSAVFDQFCTPVPLPEQSWERDVLARATSVGTVEHAGDDLPVYQWGRGPTVVLTHGWGSRAAHLAALAQAVADAGFSAVAYDGPAHTRAAIAGRARQQATFVDFARALQAVAELVGPVHALVGHSGGGTSSAFAASGFADMLVATPDVPPSSARGGNQTIGVDRLVLVSAPDRLATIMATWSELSGAGPQVIEPLHRETLRRFEMPVEAFSVSAHARLLPEHTLLIHDSGDMRVPISEAQRIDDALGGGHLVTTRGLGHSGALIDGDVAARIVAYLDQR